MVVARDRYVAEDAAGAIVVDYEPLPVVADLDGRDAPLVHLDRPDNVVARVAEEHGDVDAAHGRGARTCSSGASRSSAAPPTPLEGRAVVARFDEEGALLVHDATQAPTGIRDGLSRLFDLDLEQVHVVAPDVGGGFGVKVIQFYPEEVLVPLRRPQARDAGQVDRGPARALHRLHARAQADPPRARGRATTTAGSSRSRRASCTTAAPTARTG